MFLKARKKASPTDLNCVTMWFVQQRAVRCLISATVQCTNVWNKICYLSLKCKISCLHFVSLSQAFNSHIQLIYKYIILADISDIRIFLLQKPYVSGPYYRNVLL